MHVANKGRVISLALAAIFVAGFLLAFDVDKLPPDNWTVPSARAGIRTTMVDATSPRLFIGLAPCRIVDTRGNGAPIQGGPFSTNQIRTWAIAGNCGVPAGADAISGNLTVTGTGANPFGFGTIWPTGAAQPTASTINWSSAGQTIANAVIVPLGTSGSVNVISGNAGTDMVFDVNGYFSSVLGTPDNFFQLTTNSSSYTAFFQNLSTVCGGACGVRQSVESGYAGLFINNHATQTGARGVRGQISSTGDGAAGVEGVSFGGTGQTFGVLGRNFSATGEASAVKGLDKARPTTDTTGVGIGVLGESVNGFGVLGRSRQFAIVGKLYDGSGINTVEGLLGTTFGTAADTTAGPWAVFANGNFGASGAKHFVEPHPTDAKKVIMYSSLEGREVGTYFRGTARFVNRVAIIDIPEDFRTVTDSEGLTVQVTAIGGFAQVYVESQDLNQIVVRSSRDVQFHYMVNGVRKAFKDFGPIQTDYMFVPQSADARMPRYLTEEAKSRLISNGTYNADGTVNMDSAQKNGWVQMWAQKESEAKAVSAAAVAEDKKK